MALETPISAWQPPIAADRVAPFLNRLPITPAVSRNGSTAALARLVEADAVQEHGRDHARRPVGRRRDHPAERRVLLVHRQGEAAHPLEDLAGTRAPRRGWPAIQRVGVGGRSAGRPSVAQQRSIEPRRPADDAQAAGQRPRRVGTAVGALAHRRPDPLAGPRGSRRGRARRSSLRRTTSGMVRPVARQWPSRSAAVSIGIGQGRVARPARRRRSPLADHEAAADRVVGLRVRRAVLAASP